MPCLVMHLDWWRRRVAAMAAIGTWTGGGDWQKRGQQQEGRTGNLKSRKRASQVSPRLEAYKMVYI